MDISWQDIEAEQVWCYVHAGVSGATAFVLFCFGAAALCTVRRRKDPARLAFLWLKLVFAFEVP